jgi:GGDEF domain-containing protein
MVSRRVVSRVLGLRLLGLNASVRRVRNGLTPTQRVVALTLALLTVATIGATALPGGGSLSPITHVTWWMLAIGFLVTEVFVVHVDVRRDTYSVSMMELPLVVGLFLAGPVAVVGGRLAGAAIALFLFRRQTPLKASFNLSLYLTETIVAILVFRALVGASSAVEPSSWVAAFTAMLVANVVSVAGVMSAMRLHGAQLAGRARRMLVAALVPPVANTSLALAAVMLLWRDPRSVWLLGAITIVVSAAYRGYASLKHRYANLQHLYEFTRRLQVADTEHAIVEILTAARGMMRAERADLVVVADHDAAQRWSVGPRVVTDEHVTWSDLSELLADAIEQRAPVLVPANTRVERERRALLAQGWRDCLVVPIVTDDVVVAVMAVVDREDDVSTFDADDLRLFQALVNHAAIAMNNAQLVLQLRHDTLHDALTALPNRTAFAAHVEAAIRRREPGTKLAVMLLDLDRFKEVNDTLGHHYGDQLLREVGGRLGEFIGRGGAVARLGGDEFALLLTDIGDREDAMAGARFVRDLSR